MQNAIFRTIKDNANIAYTFPWKRLWAFSSPFSLFLPLPSPISFPQCTLGPWKVVLRGRCRPSGKLRLCRPTLFLHMLPAALPPCLPLPVHRLRAPAPSLDKHLPRSPTQQLLWGQGRTRRQA